MCGFLHVRTKTWKTWNEPDVAPYYCVVSRCCIFEKYSLCFEVVIAAWFAWYITSLLMLCLFPFPVLSQEQCNALLLTLDVIDSIYSSWTSMLIDEYLNNLQVFRSEVLEIVQNAFHWWNVDISLRFWYFSILSPQISFLVSKHTLGTWVQ